MKILVILINQSENQICGKNSSKFRIIRIRVHQYYLRNFMPLCDGCAFSFLGMERNFIPIAYDLNFKLKINFLLEHNETISWKWLEVVGIAAFPLLLINVYKYQCYYY